MLWSASVSRKSPLAALFATPPCTIHELQSMPPIITWSLGVGLAVILARSVPNWAELWLSGYAVCLLHKQ